jgi:hypothetical protein
MYVLGADQRKTMTLQETKNTKYAAKQKVA